MLFSLIFVVRDFTQNQKKRFCVNLFCLWERARERERDEIKSVLTFLWYAFSHLDGGWYLSLINIYFWVCLEIIFIYLSMLLNCIILSRFMILVNK